LLALVGTAVAYAVVGWLALWLAIPPGYASPLYPAAGVALASVLVFGWRMLPAVALGSFAVNVTLGAERGVFALSAFVLPATIALGAMAQAALGAWLVKRFVTQPLRLSELRDILLFFVVGGALACLTNATLSAFALQRLAQQPAAELLYTWWTWWAGDTLGVLIAAPITLTLIGEPHEDWAQRRRSIGLTLTIAAALMALSMRQVAQWEEERVQTAFDRDAVHASAALSAWLQSPLHALQAVHGVFVSSDEVSREEMQRASSVWLTPENHLQAIGWSEIVPREAVAEFEARVRREDKLPDYRVFDRPPGAPGSDDHLVVARYIEPHASNAAALGVNSRSVPQAREAIDLAIRTDRPASSAGFRLTQETADQTGVVIYHAVYRGQPTNEAERRAAAQGVVFTTLRMDDALAAFQGSMPPYLQLCLIDTEPRSQFRRLAGRAGCEERTLDLNHVRPLAFAGRQWELRVSARRQDVPETHERNALPYSLVALLATAMLGALLLSVTGRTRRIEVAVKDRTTALQREIAEREQTEADLRESEQRFRNILNNVPIGVVYTDLNGNVKQVNPRFCQLTGYTADELSGMNVATLTHPDDRENDAPLAEQLVRDEIPMYRRQGRYLTRDGRMVWVQSIVTLLRDLQGRPRRIVAVVEDITEHMRLAEAERAREVAEMANRAKSDFLSRMSHELRTPLNAMLGFAQLLELDQSHPLPESQRPWVTQIQNAGWHLLDMINDVLDLSRIESGTLSLMADPLDLRELVAATRAMVERDAQRRNLTISTDLSDEVPRVKGDATRVKQILTNLLSNAVKYNIDGGRIHVSARAVARDTVEITVTDTGLGMTAHQLAQLFQPFNRLGRERSTMEGTGIGLVISQRLAELMGGALRARSTAGEGSSFVLTLPRAETPVGEAPPAPQPVAAGSNYHQRTVHYVEDNETNVEVMRGILSRRPQVQLDVSVTGLDGLASIRQRRPDLILLDMHLPDIDGMELLRHLKADAKTADIPVVVVSADALPAQIEIAMQAGAQQYLTKPVSVNQLLAVVDAVLESADTAFQQMN
jgi:PAS domain S-box-containing protein